MTNKEIEKEAFERQVDYKPFEESLSYKLYFYRGFIEGAKWACKQLFKSKEKKEKK